jgi:hypothetical protein
VEVRKRARADADLAEAVAKICVAVDIRPGIEAFNEGRKIDLIGVGVAGDIVPVERGHLDPRTFNVVAYHDLTINSLHRPRDCGVQDEGQQHHDPAGRTRRGSEGEHGFSITVMRKGAAVVAVLFDRFFVTTSCTGKRFKAGASN